MNKIMIMDMGFTDILPEMAALIVLTAIYFAIGVGLFWRRHMRL